MPNPNPHPIKRPPSKISGLFGFSGFSGVLAGSMTRNCSPFCRLSKFSAILALSFFSSSAW